MEKAAIFFCDIQGTYSYGDETDKRKFCSYLSELKDMYKVDKVIFSFITGDSDRNYLDNYVRDVSKYIDHSEISLGAQFYSMGYIDEDNIFNSCFESKSNQIVTYINKLKENYEIEKVFFADDRIDLSDYDNIQRSFEYDLDLTIFVPGSYFNDRSNKKITSTSSGLSGLNECFEFIINPENIKKYDLKKLKDKLEKEQIQQEKREKEKLEQGKLQKEKEKNTPVTSKLQTNIEIATPNLEDDSYFDYLINREEETYIQSDDLSDINHLLDISLNKYFASSDFYLEKYYSEYEEPKENYETNMFFKYSYQLMYEDAKIEKSDDYCWYEEEHFKEDFSRYKYITDENKESYFYPNMNTDLSDLLYGDFYDCYVEGMEYKEPNTYTVEEIKYIMNQTPIELFLMQYVNKIKFSGGKYKVRCSQIRHDDNMYLVAYPNSKQLSCSDCGHTMNLLNYILENEFEQRNNIVGIYELIDTLIYTLKIKNINLRDDYNINEKLKERILCCLSSDTYKSFREDQQLYAKTKKIIPKYRN